MARGQTAKVLATTLFGTLDTTALLPVIAVYSLSLGADALQTGIIVGLYSAVHAPANFFFGRLVDRTGTRWPLRFGLLWDAVSVLLYSLAATPFSLALVRVSHGLGGALVGPSTMSLAAEGSVPARRGRAMAYYGMVIALAFIVGTGMAVPIELRLGIQWLFYILSAGLMVGFAISLRIREPRPVAPASRADWPLALRYMRGPEPFAGYAAIFSLHFLQGTVVALVALLIQVRFGAVDASFGAAMRGASFTALAIASMIAHYFGGTMADRRGSATPAIIGLVVVGVAMASIPFVSGPTVFLALMVLFGAGHGFVFPSSSALVTRHAPPSILGLVTGLFYAVLVTGVAVGAPAMGAVASATDDLGTAIALSAVFVLPGIVFAARALASTTVSKEAPQTATR